MRKNTFVRITELLLRALLLIIVGAYVYLKSTSAVKAPDVAPGKIPAVLKDFGKHKAPLEQKASSADELFLWGEIKAGQQIFESSRTPVMFYRRNK